MTTDILSLDRLHGLGALLARAIRQVRMGFGWSQAELARRVGSSQSMIARLESGRLSELNLALANSVLRELGIRPWFDTRIPGIPDRRRQRDGVHARCCGFTGRRLLDDGWEVRHEVEVGTGRRRGWIDLLAYRRADHGLFCPEVKTELHDIGAVQRTLAWYERESWAAARSVGWTPRRLASGLILLCSTENDDLVAANREILAQTFPASAPMLGRWLRDPAAPLASRAIAMVDPRSRRADWLRPTRSHGRRARAPYANYAGAAAALG